MEAFQKIARHKAILEKIGLFLLFAVFIGEAPVYSQSKPFDRKFIPAFEKGSSGVAVAVTDVNLDGLEDIVRFREAKRLQIFLQCPNGRFELYKTFPKVAFKQWNILGMPINDDRWLDWLSAGFNSGLRYWMSDTTGMYDQIFDNRFQFFAQASNALDLNQSGNLDVFMCSDLSENYTFFNNGAIPFDRAFVLPPNHPDSFYRSGNYGSVWEDLNGDNRPDLYLSKCYAFANHPSDPRRINKLFLSQPNGSYEEMAKEWNIADSAQSWASSFADVNNDGLMDLLVINHDEPSSLYINKETHFLKSKDFEELEIDFNSVQVLSHDFDCDGFIDFLITGERATILMNENGTDFSERPELLGRYAAGIASAQVGDFNQDGYLDIFAIRQGLYNNPGFLEDLLLFNPFNVKENNYIRFQILDSLFYKMDGVQVKAKLFSNLGMQSRTVRIGESYGVCGSNILHFGIGKDTAIDSVVFDWPDGHSETYFPAESNTLYLYTKGVGLRSESELEFVNSCFSKGDTTQIANIDAASGNLSVFHDEREIDFEESQNVFEAGRYFWIDRDEDGAWLRAKPKYLEENAPVDSRLNYAGQIELCDGESMVLRPQDRNHFSFWNNGSASLELLVDEPGRYEAFFTSCSDTVSSEPVIVSYRPEVSLSIKNDTVARGDRAMLRATGNNIYWFRYADSNAPLQKGSGLFLIPGLDKDTVLFVESRDTFNRLAFTIAPSLIENQIKVSDRWMNAEIYFNALADCTLKRITVRTIRPGRRDVILWEENVGVRERRSYVLDSNRTYTLDLDWNLESGKQYSLRTDASVNLDQFDFPGPSLYSIDRDSFDFPYFDGEYIMITETSLGINEFPYFFNWEIEPPPDTCRSERLPVRGIIDGSTSQQYGIQGQIIEVFPNPAKQFFDLTLPEFGDWQIEIMNTYGQLMHSSRISGDMKSIRCGAWPAGMYVVFVSNGSSRYSLSMVISR